LMHDAGVPKNRRLAGHECCGLICECNGKFKRTAPHRGSSALATAKNNAERATRWKPRTKETEPQWAGAECRPFSAKCPKGWNTVAWYHSHPNDVSFSDADKLGEKFTAYVTRCPSGKTDRFEPDRDEKTDYKGVSTYNI
jgi:proteasome lid subunit RPN8/RPN11